MECYIIAHTQFSLKFTTLKFAGIHLAPLMANLYSDHPTVSHTLMDFTEHANDLFFEGNEGDDAYIRFVLTGEYVDDEDNYRQAFVDPLRGHIQDGDDLRISRDYDSLLGIADKLLIDGPITVYAVPHSTFALKTSIHLEHQIVRDEVS